MLKLLQIIAMLLICGTLYYGFQMTKTAHEQMEASIEESDSSESSE